MSHWLHFLAFRFFSTFITLLVTSFLVFLVLRNIAGGPLDTEHALPRETREVLLARLNLDQSLPKQFVQYWKKLIHGDLGQTNQFDPLQVREVISQAFLVSAILGIFAFLLSLLLGLLIGITCAANVNSWIDRSLSALILGSISIPNFLVAAALIFVFSLQLNWLPPALFENASSLVLPVIALSIRPIAIISRVSRISMIEVLKSDYIRTAFAKGLSFAHVLLKHALRNTLPAVLAVLGPILASLISGSFVIESIFALPGLGKYFVQAVLNRDYFLLQGVTLLYAVLLLSVNMLTDFLSYFIDPRTRGPT